ncbi:hypothetical protein EJ03DRAFT_317603 [Teratosphaeria nubilosa]|uniref:Peroxisomal membrane protein PEX14 n=1 Tax=Teratosphaeria nubilosa TaxID=161662 RepID=A0A6G1L1Y9_9PEZI|nr:hypothetical protein EJ03DRAFT_317603 [Teratosphaeria nubilosa]
MVREDLIDGAISFLQDPSVASAPLEQRIAFLRSKNLTQDEIDTSLARVGSPPAQQSSSSAPQYQPQYRAPPQQYGYPPQPGYWQQPPPELPRRDWRDWFIMATVVGGIGYAAYWTARRYVYPLIAPPTPPQLEQDKQQVDEAFKQAFDLLEQLSKDTTELKEAETQRKQRLDATLADVEAILGRMKTAHEDRELEAKRMARELAEIKDQVPQAIEKEKEHMDKRLVELTAEMKSLKTLVGNRMQQPQPPPPSRSPQPYTQPAQQQQQQQQQTAPQVPPPQTNGHHHHQQQPTATPVPPETNGSTITDEGNKPVTANPVTTPRSGSAFGGRPLGGGRAAIPEWQLAAKKRNEEKKDASGASTPAAPAVESESGAGG